jgi:hypothetical protein
VGFIAGVRIAAGPGGCYISGPSRPSKLQRRQTVGNHDHPSGIDGYTVILFPDILVNETIFGNFKSRPRPSVGWNAQWDFWAEARNERRARMGSLLGSLCERRGRHVTRSFCRPCRHPPAFPFGWFKEPPFRFNFAHPPLPVQIPKKLR